MDDRDELKNITQKTLENDAFAASFQDVLSQELQRRNVRTTKVTAVNFSNVNIDVHIWIEDYWHYYLFKYIGIGWLKRRKLAEMTLVDYVKGYVDGELHELKDNVDFEIKDCSERLKDTSNMWEYDIVRTQKRLKDAQKIASWLAE